MWVPSGGTLPTHRAPSIPLPLPQHTATTQWTRVVPGSGRRAPQVPASCHTDGGDDRRSRCRTGAYAGGCVRPHPPAGVLHCPLVTGRQDCHGTLRAGAGLTWRRGPTAGHGRRPGQSSLSGPAGSACGEGHTCLLELCLQGCIFRVQVLHERLQLLEPLICTGSAGLPRQHARPIQGKGF